MRQLHGRIPAVQHRTSAAGWPCRPLPARSSVALMTAAPRPDDVSTRSSSAVVMAMATRPNSHGVRYRAMTTGGDQPGDPVGCLPTASWRPWRRRTIARQRAWHAVSRAGSCCILKGCGKVLTHVSCDERRVEDAVGGAFDGAECRCRRCRRPAARRAGAAGGTGLRPCWNSAARNGTLPAARRNTAV